LFGGSKGGANTTFDNTGFLSSVGFYATPGMEFNETSHSTVFNGSQYITSNTTLALGIKSQIPPAPAYVQTGFSVVISFVTKSVSETHTIWEFLDGEDAFISLKIEPPSYMLNFRKGLGDANQFRGPVARADERMRLLVRCVPGMLLCTIIDLA
jgi:hypothetical protein